MRLTEPRMLFKVEDAEVAFSAKERTHSAGFMIVIYIKAALIRNLIANRAMALRLKSHRVVLFARETIESSDMFSVVTPCPRTNWHSAPIFTALPIICTKALKIIGAVLSGERNLLLSILAVMRLEIFPSGFRIGMWHSGSIA